MTVPLEPVREFACTIAGCYKSYDTKKEMQYHKRDDPTHFYCKRCDVDCNPQTWDAFVEHKVDAMAPWVECRKDKRPERLPKHITCEFCGEDFQSIGGRLRHRELRHQAEQSIPCPGCKEVFGRAGDMIGHLENGECGEISEWEFYAFVQHKYVKKEIMKDLEAFTENLQINPAFATPPVTPGLIEAEKATESIDTDMDGGVLLDQEDEEQKGGDQPLEAQLASIDLGGKRVPLTRSNLEIWPRLPNQPKSEVSDHVLKQSVGSSPPSVIGTDIPASQFASQITSRRGGVKVHTESYPSLQSSTLASECGHSTRGDVEDDDASVSTAKAESVLNREAAWKTTGTSRALFGDMKAPPQTEEMKSILKKRREDDNKAPNLLLNARWWDPHSDEYNPNLFLHGVTQRYCCPFPSCDIYPFDHPYDIEQHLLQAHARVQFRCPGCLKLLRKAQGMMSHMESTTKCPIRKSKNFKLVLDDITGAIVKAKRLPQPSIYRTNTSVVKSGQVLNGVMSTMYKSSLPSAK